MTLTENLHWTLLFDVRPGDIVTHFDPASGEPTTFEVRRLVDTGSTAYVAMDTTIGPIQALAGTPVAVFDGFDLAL